MHIHVGTSGYSYKEWKGSFYPEKLPAAKMLPYYAERFDAVEINNTFYRVPDAKLLDGWSGQVGGRFRFALKIPQRITHVKRLASAEEDIRYFCEISERLGEKRGPLLFQTPPYLRRNDDALRAALGAVPEGARAAFEFRHDSWRDEAVEAILAEHGAALCIAQTDEDPEAGGLMRPTATWGYLRLRRTNYDEAAIAEWARLVKAQTWTEAFVFFKHEDEAKGPQFAQKFRELTAASPGPPS